MSDEDKATELTEEDKELIAWFQNRSLPESSPKHPYQVNRYTRTDDLANMIELAIGHVKRGNSTSKALLIELKAKLENEQHKQQ